MLRPSRSSRTGAFRTAAVPVLAATLAWAGGGCRRSDLPGGAPIGPAGTAVQAPPRPAEAPLSWPDAEADRLRAETLRRARVWQEPAVPIPDADLAKNPQGAGAFAPTDVVTCRFQLKSAEGITPKFQCLLPDGETVKVKYGRRNAEIFAEVAGTRLLQALGFGADHMSVVAAVRCLGCPPFPYPKLEVLDAVLMDEGRAVDFRWVIIERLLPGREIRGRERKGWEWSELATIDQAAGGSPRAEVDALRLLAVFLAHWDGKADNQRLTCPPGQETEGSPAGCRTPIALISDLGKTFGPKDIDLEAWSSRPVFSEPATCAVSMKGMPFDGGGFEDMRIGEAGRLFLATRLRQLSRQQVESLFRGARFQDFTGVPEKHRDPALWADAFLKRVAQIADRPPCPH